MFDPFQKYLARAANRYGVGREVSAATVCQSFRTLIPKIFQKEAGDYISPASFKNATLTINVENQAWAEQVIMRKHKIIEELNDKAGKVVIKSLRTQLTDPQR